MNTIKRILTTLLAVVLLSSPLITMAGNQGKDVEWKPQNTDTSLDAIKIRNLNYIREEEKLAVLYDTLVADGSQSSLKALLVGAKIEEIDIIDLQRAIDETDNTDIQSLYENLMSGSRNHLRAYVSQIENLGIVYEAQHLPQSEMDSVVDSPMERGR